MQFSDVHCFTESLIQIFHHQQANNTIHLHKTFTCLFLDSEWVCKGWKTLMHLDSISTLLISDRSWRTKKYSTTTPSIIRECQCSFTCPYIQCKQGWRWAWQPTRKPQVKAHKHADTSKLKYRPGLARIDFKKQRRKRWERQVIEQPSWHVLKELGSSWSMIPED